MRSQGANALPEEDVWGLRPGSPRVIREVRDARVRGAPSPLAHSYPSIGGPCTAPPPPILVSRAFNFKGPAAWSPHARFFPGRITSWTGWQLCRPPRQKINRHSGRPPSAPPPSALLVSPAHRGWQGRPSGQGGGTEGLGGLADASGCRSAILPLLAVWRRTRYLTSVRGRSAV